MDREESVVQLGAQLDKWFDKNLATFQSQDRAGQGRALIEGMELVKELNRLKTDGLATIRALIKHERAIAPEQQIASLLRGFEFATRLADALHDELLDTEGETKLVRLKNDIADALDAIGDGRIVLSTLLDHPDAGVRASAGAYLLIVNLIPERVVPILREIEEKEDGNSAHFKAHWAILDWELKEKARAGKQ